MYYEVTISNKKAIIINEEDYNKLVKNIASNFVVMSNGEIINPSYIMLITKVSKPKIIEIEESKQVKKITGHVDYERGVYVIDQVTEKPE